MNNRITMRVSNLIGGRNCISTKDGQMVFKKVEQYLKEGKQVTISFENITMLIPHFLNVAIGQLYGSFDKGVIKEKLEIQGLSADDLELLKGVVDNAKRYYENQNNYDKA